ncbi:ankyrin repeat domain-containing protein [Marinobacter caseinilyticus]|uniref:ankyrin repeat domain-containing protein n=1 Tax=Marinobacter caseinilyticus TaxID=2692195 RepID=UPI00140A8131|nr:ankyrin repeat domain-containing protein [Marinobacter caseinilyticus]
MTAQGFGAHALIVTCVALLLASCTTAPTPANLDRQQAQAVNSPLFQAVVQGDVDAVTALAERGAALNTVTEQGTPLARAALSGYDRIAWYLLSQGAAPDLSGEQGLTPLMIAAREGHRRLAQLLLSAGADVNATSADGSTPVFLAVLSGNLSVVKVLLAAGANVNVSRDGRSLLMHTVDGGDLLTAEVLLAAGADVDFEDAQGLTALDLARARGNQDMEMLLIQAGAGA